MRCIKCGEVKIDGGFISTLKDKYRICGKCLDEIEIPPEERIKMPIIKGMFKTKREQQLYDRKVKKAYLQKQLDKKLLKLIANTSNEV